jgi:HAD superfamily hydrolase (TIGR01509 family)
LAGGDATSERIARIANAKEELYCRKMRSQGISPLPGALTLLDGLCDEGWLQAVISTAPTRILKELLGGLRTKCFQAAISPDNVSWGRPDPEIYLTAARGIKIPPERCIVVESSPTGVEGARRAGMKTIAIGRVYKVVHADVVVASLEELNVSTFGLLLAEGRTSCLESSARWTSSAANNLSLANSPWTNLALGD